MLGSWLLSITSTHSTFQSPHPWRAVLPLSCLALPLGSSLSALLLFFSRPGPVHWTCSIYFLLLLWSLSDTSGCFLSHVYNKILSLNHIMEHHVSWSQFKQSGFRTKVNLLRKNNLFIVKLSANFYFEVLN